MVSAFGDFFIVSNEIKPSSFQFPKLITAYPQDRFIVCNRSHCFPERFIPAGNIHSAAEALLIFLEALREPVISFDQYDDALSAASSRAQCVDVS